MTRLVIFVLAALSALLIACVFLADARGECPAPVRYARPAVYPASPYYAPAIKEVIVEKVVEKPVVFTKFVPVTPIAYVEYAVLPTYSAQFVQPTAIAPPPPQPAIAQPAPIQAPALQPPPQQRAPLPQAQAPPCEVALARAMALMDRFEARLSRLEGKQPAPPAQQQKGQAPPAKQEGQGQGQAQAELPAPLAVVQGKCAMCHSDKTAEKLGAGLVLITNDVLEKLPAKRINKLVGHVTKSTMPPREKPKDWVGEYPAPLTDAEAYVLITKYTE